MKDKEVESIGQEVISMNDHGLGNEKREMKALKSEDSVHAGNNGD